MDQLKVSIIVPIYNMERYLEQCIQSLLNQTYKNIEIILVNDGSSDKSAFICKKYAGQDSRIIYVEQDNQGVSAARNEGLYRATGYWIAFVDGDDWIALDMIAALVKNAGSNDVVIGDVYAVKDSQVIRTGFFRPDISEYCKGKTLYLIGNSLGCFAYGITELCNLGVPWARLYRRVFILENHLEFTVGIRRMQDMIFNINVFAKTQKIGFCNYPVYYYRITGESACRRYDPHFTAVMDQVLSEINDLIGNSPDPEIQSLYVFKRLQLLQENISLYYGHLQCTLSYKEKKQGIKQLCLVEENVTALNTYDNRLFSKKQQIILWLLAHHFYGVVYELYAVRNIRRRLLECDLSTRR